MYLEFSSNSKTRESAAWTGSQTFIERKWNIVYELGYMLGAIADNCRSNSNDVGTENLPKRFLKICRSSF